MSAVAISGRGWWWALSAPARVPDPQTGKGAVRVAAGVLSTVCGVCGGTLERREGSRTVIHLGKAGACSNRRIFPRLVSE